MLLTSGIQDIWAVCSHGVFTGGALEKLTAVPQITEIVATDTVFTPPGRRPPQLKILPVASIFGEAIRRNYRHESISDLFVFGQQ